MIMIEKPPGDLPSYVFATIGVALAAGAAIELAYNLFTHGPDEAFDPLMLGLSAAIILQLGKVHGFDLKQAASAIIYVVALGATFAIRKRLAEKIVVNDPKDSDPILDWLQHPLKRFKVWRTKQTRRRARARRRARRQTDAQSSGETSHSPSAQAGDGDRSAS
jgi:hypothetical protein